MFEEIGGKIKGLAQITCFIGIVASIIAGIVMFATSFWLGILIIIGGCLSSWIGSFALYGYGEMIEATCETRNMVYEFIHRKSVTSGTNEPAHASSVTNPTGTKVNPSAALKNAVSGGWQCSCGRVNYPYVMNCVCGAPKFKNANKKTEE